MLFLIDLLRFVIFANFLTPHHSPLTAAFREASVHQRIAQALIVADDVVHPAAVAVGGEVVGVGGKGEGMFVQ